MKSTILRKVLVANAFYSSLSGITIIAIAGILGEMMGIPNLWILRIIGGGLVLFALSILPAIKKLPGNTKPARSIAFQDWAWVAGAVAIISLQLFDMTNSGYWILGIVSVPVAIFAFLQTRYT